MAMDRIIKGIGGFYYVKTSEGVFECKARGAFRRKKLKPYVGDYVRITIRDNGENTIDEILERKNELIRPPVSNIDNLIIVSSMVTPAPNPLVIDKLSAVCEMKHIEPIMVFNKTDVLDGSELCRVYRHAGFTSFCTSAKTGEGMEQLKSILKSKTSVFTGNSGAGKSSILNALSPALHLETGEVSEKLGRGRHTTRSCEIYELFGGQVVDTPGFSSLEIGRLETIMKEDLPFCFREFRDYVHACRFSSCSHTKEQGCAVLKAVEEGKIERSRFESYLQLYEEIKDIKPWQVNK